jgi:hypothetical protein
MLYNILEFFLRVFLGTSLVIITFMAIIAVGCLLPFIIIGAGIYTLWDIVSDRRQNVS